MSHRRRRRRELRPRSGLATPPAQVLLSVAFLADQARLLVDADRPDARPAVRHRRRLLEWETAAATERRLGDGLAHVRPDDVVSPAAGRSLLAPRLVFGRPAGARRGRPRSWSRGSSRRWSPSGSAGRRAVAEAAADRRGANGRCGGSPARPGTSSRPSSAKRTTGCRRTTTRKTARGAVAHRTSPTNMGLYLLSTPRRPRLRLPQPRRPCSSGWRRPSTRSTGWSGTHGHFYNWYDTRTLQPLPPILRLDGGQRQPARLPGHAQAGAAREGRGADSESGDPRRAWPTRWTLLAEALRPLQAAGRRRGQRRRSMQPAVEEARGLLAEAPLDLIGWDDWLRPAGRGGDDVDGAVGEVRAGNRGRPGGAAALGRGVRRPGARTREELAALAPWLGLLRAVAAGGGRGPPALGATLRALLAAPISVAAVLAARRRCRRS